MSFEPQKFFIGVIDLFSVLLPGALLTYVFMDDMGPFFLGEGYCRLENTAGWLAFLFSSYLFGHFIFLLGAAFLDDLLYDRIRNASYMQEIRRLADGRKRSNAISRFIAKLVIKKQTDEAQDRAIRIKEYYTRPLGSTAAINAFQWCKARLTLEGCSEATAAVQRFEADSKFFRSFAVLILILIVWSFSSGRVLLALISIPFFLLALWRYIDQRVKAVNQAYWYVIAMEAKSARGYRQPRVDQSARPTHSGGVVYRTGGAAGPPEFLLVQAKQNPDDWVLPKGHIELHERVQEAGVREVLEETGTWARIVQPLETIQFEADNETVVAQFYLMEAMSTGKSSEQRATKWLVLDDALREVKHPESKELLLSASKILSVEHGQPMGSVGS